MTLWSVHKGVPKQTCKNCLRRKQACKLMDQIWTVQQFCASPGRSFCHGNEHRGIDPSIFSSGPSWLFHKGWLSLNCCQTAILPHLGTLNSTYWALSAFQSSFIWAISFGCSMTLWSVHKGVPKQTCKNCLRRKQACKLMDQIWTVQQFCASPGRSFCHGNEHRGIDPSIFSSGPSWLFHKGWLSLNCCQTAILPHLGTLNSTYWALSAFQSSFIWAISFGCSMTLWSVHKGVPKQTCKNCLRRKQACKLMDQIWTVQQFCASPGRSFCHGNEHRGIDPSIFSSGPSWLFHKGWLSLNCCQTAILPHLGTLNSTYWALSAFQSSFIWAISFGCSMTLWSVHKGVPKQTCKNCLRRKQACKLMDQIWTVQQFCASPGRSFCHGNEHRGIDPSIFSSGPSWLFHKGWLSLNCCQTAILPHLGTLNSTYWALSAFQSSFIWAISFGCSMTLWSVHKGVPKQTCKNCLRRKQACKLMDQIWTVQQFCASPGRSFCHGNEHRGIDPSIFSSGPSWLFHKGWLSLNCCQTAILPHLGTLNSTYWALSAFQSSFIWAISFGCSMTLWSVHKGVPKQTCKNCLRRKQACKLMDQIWTVQQFCASPGRSFCHGNEHRGIDPSIFSSGPSWLFHKGWLSLNCCQTAILPHLGTLNSTYWALSAFQSSFIWAISFGCSMTLWSVHKGVPKQTCKNCLRRKQACKLMDQIWTVQQFCASPGRSFCHGNEHRGIDPSIFSSGPSWLFHKGWLSLNCCQTAILPHLGTLNSTYWALSAFQSSFIWAISFGCSMTLWSVHKGVPKQTCKNCLRRKQACKLMDQIWTVQQFCASPGRSFCHGNEHRGIDPSIFSSGPSWLFHKGWLSLNCCQTAILPHLGTLNSTYWALSAFQSSFIWAISFGCSMTLWSVHKGVPKQTCKNCLRRKQACKLMDQIWTVQQFCASPGRSFCHGNEHRGIDPSIFSSGPSWLFHKGWLSLNCCQTAILPHLGTLNSTYWALSAFQSSFIWAISFGCSMTLWSVHKGVPKQTCKNCLRRKQACKLMDQIWTVQQFCASPGRSFCHGNEHRGIDPSIFSSGPSWLFHKGWLSLNCCQTAILPHLGTLNSTYWALSAFQSSFIWAISFGCSMTLWSVHKGVPKQTCKNCLRRKQACKLMDQIWTVQQFCASPGRSFCHGNEHRGIDPSIFSSGPSWLFHKGWLSLNCCQTAILPHLGTLNSTYWALSAFQSSFIWAISFGCSMTLWSVHKGVPKQTCKNCLRRKQACKLMDQIWTVQQFCASPGRSFCHGNEHRGIDPSIFSSGPSWLFHKGWLSLNCCQTAILPHLGTLNSTYWALAAFQSSFIWAISFGCSMTLWSVHKGVPKQTCKNCLRRKQACKLMDQIWTVQQFCASPGRSFCHGNEHRGIDPSIFSSGPSWLFHKGWLSLNCCQTAILPHLGTLNSTYWALSAFQSSFIWAISFGCSMTLWSVHKGVPKQTCKNCLRRKQACKLMDQIWTVQQFCASPGRSFCHGNEHRGIDPSIFSSGPSWLFHKGWLSLNCCQTAILPHLGTLNSTYWALSAFQSSFIWAISFGCSMTLWSVHKGVPKQTCKNCLRRKQACKLMDQIWTVQQFCASPGRSFCHGNEHRGIDPSIFSSGPSWLFHKGWLSLNCCQTAILPHLGTLNSTYWALSAFQSSFIWAISFGCSMTLWSVHKGVPKQTCKNCLRRKQACKLMDQIWTVQQFCASPGRSFCHGNEHRGIDPSIFSSGPSWLFHKGWLSLNCCQTAILPHLGTLNSTYWALSAFQSSFIWAISFGCSMTLWSVHKGVPKQTCKNCLRRKQACKLMDQIWTVQQFCASPGRSFCHGNEHRGIDPSIFSSGPSWLFHKGWLSLNCCQTAILPHLGTLNSTYWALSAFQSSFIWAISFGCSMTLWSVHKGVPKQTCKNCLRRKQACKLMDQIWTVQQFCASPGRSFCHGNEHRGIDPSIFSSGPSWLFHKGWLSLNCCQTAILPHLGTLNSTYWALSAFQSSFIWAISFGCSMTLWSVHKGVPKQTCKNCLRRKQACKLMDQIWTVQQFCASPGRSFCHGNEHRGIDPSIFSSGPSWLFHKGWLSLNCCQTAILPHLGTLNSTYWALSAFQSSFIWAISFGCSMTLWSVHKGVPKQTCKNCLRRKQACKLMDQIWTVQQFCASPGRSFCHGNEHRGIDPSIFSSGPSWLFHKGWLSLNCCQTAILPHLGTLNSTYWALSAFQSSFIWAISFGCSMTLWSVHKGVPKQTCKNCLRRKQACKLMDQIWTVQQFCASPGRSFCHGNEHRGIDPSIFSSGPSWLFHKGWLSLNCCQTAILPHLGTLNSTYWALSAFQSSFIWAISFGCSMTLWSVHKGVPKQTCKNCLRRKQACKLMDQIWTVQQFCASPGRSFCHGNEHRGIDPSIFSSGPSWLFHKGWLSLNCCQTAILPHLGTLNSTYWALSAFQSSFIWAISFGCSMTLWSVHKGVPKQTCKNCLRRKQACKLMDQIWTVQQFCASPGRSFCHGNEHRGIDPSIFSSGPSWLFHKGWLSIPVEITQEDLCNQLGCSQPAPLQRGQHPPRPKALHKGITGLGYQ